MSGSLSDSPGAVVRKLLVDLSLGVEPTSAGTEWQVFHAREPNKPDSVITVYDTEGRRQGRSMVSGEALEHFGVQVRVRDANHADGFTKSRAIAVALDESVNQTSVTVGSNVYMVYAITRTSGPLSIGKEPDSKRNIFTINALVALRQTT